MSKSQPNDQVQPSDADRGTIGTFENITPFRPSCWCRGGWLQTASVKLIRPKLSLDTRHNWDCISVPDDHTPPDKMSGYFFPKRIDHGELPLVIVFHGMGGHALAGYMRSMAQRLNAAGYDALLWNHRGCGRSAETCSRLHHPGYTEDVCRLLNYLTEERSGWLQNGIAGIAFSLGANLMLKYLAEAGRESRLDASVSVSAPLDMAITSQNLRTGFNRIFDRYLLQKQKEELLRDSAKISDAEKQVIADAGSVWELDDRFTAKRLGYDSADAFYADTSAIHTLDQIRTPTLCLHAEDDPVVDHNVFNGIDWAGNACLYPAMVSSGGHTGFLDRQGRRWHEQTAIAFLNEMAKMRSSIGISSRQQAS